ncbi:GNAT family N-acetyltransferase [Staphylococcus pettenkoferi]|uniref:GNAT family N-acetyltransferase n=1 Tax=Staphylococcus pettenkoferi TaxID=170573 RepID=UPI0011A090FD|nr:GNAT family N-acetyltransferase [Staphylococcus pettenkoferi]
MIRPMTQDDLYDVLDIYNHAIEHTTAVYTYEPVMITERLVWFTEKLEREEPLLVYDNDGHVAGFATYGSFRDWPAYRYTVEHSIYVDPNYQGRGVATQLLTELIRLARESGYHTMVAGIDVENSASIALHQKFNFRHCGTVTEVGHKFGRWLDLAFYQIHLGD